MICQCGGRIRTSELTGDRVAWSCSECGRYEIFGGKESVRMHQSGEGLEVEKPRPAVITPPDD